MARTKIRDVIASTNWYVILFLTQAMFIARCDWSCIIILISAILKESNYSYFVQGFKWHTLSIGRMQKIVVNCFTFLL